MLRITCRASINLIAAHLMLQGWLLSVSNASAGTSELPTNAAAGVTAYSMAMRYAAK